jgi:hypothetical protein
VTPTNLTAGTQITFDAVGDTATCIFTNSSWVVIALNGAVVS